MDRDPCVVFSQQRGCQVLYHKGIRVLAMSDKESPNKYFFSRAYLIVMKMREMGVQKMALETNRHIILRYLSSKYELVKLVLMMRNSLTRADLERMVLESYQEMERKKGGKGEQGASAHALIATNADREVTGGDDGGKDGGRNRRKGRGNGGSRQQPQQQQQQQQQQQPP